MSLSAEVLPQCSTSWQSYRMFRPQIEVSLNARYVTWQYSSALIQGVQCFPQCFVEQCWAVEHAGQSSEASNRLAAVQGRCLSFVCCLFWLRICI